MVGGDYEAPPLPPIKLLRQFFEAAYLAAAAPEEGRYTRFNLLAVPLKDGKARRLGKSWNFDKPRSFSVEEIRRLVPAVDFNKSAILTKWDNEGWQVAGLVDLGTSWARARMGLQYHYEYPKSLFVQVDRPGRMRVYQGQYLVTALVDGNLQRFKGIDIHLALHEPVNRALDKLRDRICPPQIEHPREYHNFEFTALWNIVAGIANCISDEAHGGALVLVPPESSISVNDVRIKYPQQSTVLQDAFVRFMNVRNRVVDFVIQIERGDISKTLRGEYAEAELELAKEHSDLVEAEQFVARLSGCDGAIVLSEDLRLLGFGAEIRAELEQKANIREVTDEMRNLTRPMDIEQFGLRHRSALKLVSRQGRYTAIVISQDGPISVVWMNRGGRKRKERRLLEFAHAMGVSAATNSPVVLLPQRRIALSPHREAMHGPNSLPYRATRSIPEKPFGERSKIVQPEFGPDPRSTGGAPGMRGGWKRP